MYNIHLTGHLGADAKVETTKNGSKYVTFRLGNNEFDRETTYWHTVICWENCQYYKIASGLKKGNFIYLEGKLKYDQYQDRNGINQEDKKINLTYIEYGNSGKREEGGLSTTAQQAQQPATPEPSQQKPAKPTPLQQPVQQVVPMATTNPEPDDDLPF